MRDSSFCQLPRDRNIEFTICLLISFSEIEHSYKGIRFNYQSTYECSYTYNGVFSESSLKEPKIILYSLLQKHATFVTLNAYEILLHIFLVMFFCKFFINTKTAILALLESFQHILLRNLYL